MANACEISQKKPFIEWIGWLRLLALFMVCMCHACDPLTYFGTPEQKVWSVYYGSFLRPCVPLFVMLTGALLLPVKESFGGMLRKRVSRVVMPFLLWTLIYSATPWVLHACGVSAEALQKTIFPWASPIHVDGLSVVRTFFLSLVQFNQYAVQLWYLYLLVGMYLFMPILSSWLREATLRAKLWFLGLWGLSMLAFYWPVAVDLLRHTSFGISFFADYMTRFGLPDTLAQSPALDSYQILGQCDWNATGMLSFFTGFTGYLVLGHVLKDLKLSFVKTLVIALPLLIVGYAIILLGTDWVWNAPNCSPKMFEFFWWYCSIPVAMMTTALFLLVKQCTYAPAWMIPLLKNFSRVGLSVFCAHYVFVTGSYAVLQKTGLNLSSAVMVPLSAVIGLCVTWAIVAALYKIPGARRFLG